MTTSPPTLEYGKTPVPGRITIVDQSDASVTILIPRRPMWQPLLFAGILFFLAVLIPLALYFRTGRTQLLILPVATMGVLILFTALIANWAREAFRINAGPDGLRIWYTDSGDQVCLELAREEIRDVREPSFFSTDKNNLIIETATGKRFVQMLRSRRDLRKIAAAARKGLGI